MELGFKILGKFNDIHSTAQIGNDSRIANFCYIGKDVRIGKNCVIGNFCEINNGTVIGDNTLINSHCHLNSNTIIGNDCIFGASVMTADEKYMTPHTSKITKQPCVIGNNCRIGQNSNLVCTKLGDFVSIGAGSTVLVDEIKSGEVWVGTPAKKLRNLSDYEKSL